MIEYFFDGINDMVIFFSFVSIEFIEVDFGVCFGFKDFSFVFLCLVNYIKGKIIVVWTYRFDCFFWVILNICDVFSFKFTVMRLYF